jgi:hypothetical protein
MVWVNRDRGGVVGGLLGYGIETASCEGVAAGEPTQGEPGATKQPEAEKGHIGVFGTGRQVKALSRTDAVEEWRKDGLINAISEADTESWLGFAHGVSVRRRRGHRLLLQLLSLLKGSLD